METVEGLERGRKAGNGEGGHADPEEARTQVLPSAPRCQLAKPDHQAECMSSSTHITGLASEAVVKVACCVAPSQNESRTNPISRARGTSFIRVWGSLNHTSLRRHVIS